jgi:hypothetical protein
LCQLSQGNDKYKNAILQFLRADGLVDAQEINDETYHDMIREDFDIIPHLVSITHDKEHRVYELLSIMTKQPLSERQQKTLQKILQKHLPALRSKNDDLPKSHVLTKQPFDVNQEVKQTHRAHKTQYENGMSSMISKRENKRSKLVHMVFSHSEI